MSLPQNEQDHYFCRHLKHRMTALLSPLLIGDGNDPTVGHWHGQQDVYKAASDGSMVTLRLFIEFAGLRSDSSGTRLVSIPPPTDPRSRRGRLTFSDFGAADLQRTDFRGTGPILSSLRKGDSFNEEEFIAHVHEWISVRTAHLKVMGIYEGRPTFAEHYEAAKIVLTKIYEQLYKPRHLPLNIDGTLLGRPAFQQGQEAEQFFLKNNVSTQFQGKAFPKAIWEGLPFGDWNNLP